MKMSSDAVDFAFPSSRFRSPHNVAGDRIKYLEEHVIARVP
jgi:hypothetical protein